jgi:hypothetical protein
MDVESTFKKDHPFDLKRPVPSEDGSMSFEHLLTVVPVKIRGRAVETCFLARPDVTILRQDARTRQPRLPREQKDSGFQILKLTLDAGDRVEIGPELMQIELVGVDRGKARFKLSPAESLLLDLSQIDDEQELNLRAIVGMLNLGYDYRSNAQ